MWTEPDQTSVDIDMQQPVRKQAWGYKPELTILAEPVYFEGTYNPIVSQVMDILWPLKCGVQ